MIDFKYSVFCRSFFVPFVLFLLAIVLSVLRFTASDNPLVSSINLTFIDNVRIRIVFFFVYSFHLFTQKIVEPCTLHPFKSGQLLLQMLHTVQSNEMP